MTRESYLPWTRFSRASTRAPGRTKPRRVVFLRAARRYSSAMQEPTAFLTSLSLLRSFVSEKENGRMLRFPFYRLYGLAKPRTTGNARDSFLFVLFHARGESVVREFSAKPPSSFDREGKQRNHPDGDTISVFCKSSFARDCISLHVIRKLMRRSRCRMIACV